jgi:hypothetical protein
MMAFIAGLVIGGCAGFFLCALLSVANIRHGRDDRP